MSEAVKTKKQKKSWFKGLKAEFSKIIWPDQKSLTKETIAVLVVSATVMAVQSHYGFVRVHDAEKNRRAIKMTEVILARE